MSNLLSPSDLRHRYWNKTSYNVLLKTQNNPARNTTGVITFRQKRNSSYCYCYVNNTAKMKPGKKYRCTIWAKTNYTNWRVRLYT